MSTKKKLCVCRSYTTTLSWRLTMYLNDSSSIAFHLKNHSIRKSKFRKILVENTTIMAHKTDKLRLQILEALHTWCIQQTSRLFVQAFEIVVDTWKFRMLLLYILWDDWSIFMIAGSNEQLQQELEYTLLKPDCHSCWISKMQSGREDTLEERYAIKICFKLGKKGYRNVWNASDYFWIILHELSINFWVA